MKGVNQVVAYQWRCPACGESGLEPEEEYADDLLREHLDELHD